MKKLVSGLSKFFGCKKIERLSCEPLFCLKDKNLKSEDGADLEAVILNVGEEVAQTVTVVKA